MFKIYLPLLLLFLLLSCNNQQPARQSLSSVDSVPVTIPVKDTSPVNAVTEPRPVITAKDTTLEYDIENVSLEGSDAKVHYVNGVIRGAEWHMYHETGQSVIYYTFLENGIVKAQEKNYGYPAGLESIKSKKDIRLKTSLEYKLDTNGVLLSKIADTEFVNMFEYFKKNVPLRVY